MRAAYIEETGPPEVIKIGDLPQPEPGPGQVLVKVHAAALNPIDLYLRSGLVPMPLAFPYVIGCDLAGTVAKLGQGATQLQSGRPRLGLKPRTARPTGRGGRVRGRRSKTGSIRLRNDSATTRRRRWRSSGSRPTSGFSDSASSRAARRSMCPAAPAAWARWPSRWPRPRAPGSRPRRAVPSASSFASKLGADLALNYKTDDVPARLREFAPEGVDVWYETQREPNLEVTIPLLRKRGRLILMAGRAAKPALPLGAFYPRNCSIFGFAMFNSPPEEQRHCAAEMVRFVEEGKLKPQVGRVFPLAHAAAAQRFLEENTLKGAGSLTGKIVITIE